VVVGKRSGFVESEWAVYDMKGIVVNCAADVRINIDDVFLPLGPPAHAFAVDQFVQDVGDPRSCTRCSGEVEGATRYFSRSPVQQLNESASRGDLQCVIEALGCLSKMMSQRLVSKAGYCILGGVKHRSMAVHSLHRGQCNTASRFQP